MSDWHVCPAGHSWAVRLTPTDDVPACPRCGLAAVPLAAGDAEETFRVGTAVRPTRVGEARLPRVPGYDVLDVLGQGGMGVVYRARQRSLDRLVALKMIRDGHVSSAEELLRFRAEALAVAQLAHPNIIQIHEVGEHDGLPYISLELVEGGTLADRLDAGPRPIGEAAAFVERLARAAHAAHARGVVHRDLKPANVLLADDGTPKIADFGLAKRLGVADGWTATGEVLGTPSYMAPEQANPSAGAVGPWTDVYALGAILYELLTGQPPFDAPTGIETLRRVLDTEPTPPRSLRRDVPRDLDTIALKCLAKDPRQRYLSAEELADDLARFQTGEPIRARPVGWLAVLGRRIRRNPVVASLAGGLLLIVGGLLLGGLLMWRAQGFHHRLGVGLIGEMLVEIAALEGQAQAGGDPAAFEKPLGVADRARDHAGRVGDPDLIAQVADATDRLRRGKADAEARGAEAERDAAFAARIETARVDRLLVEGDGFLAPTEGQELRRVLLDGGVPVGRATAAELAEAVRSRPRVQTAVTEALVICLAAGPPGAEADVLIDAIERLEGNPGARRVLVGVREDPEQFLAPESQAVLAQLPVVYTLVTGTQLAFRRNFDGAVRLLRAATLRQPDSFWLHYNLGHTLQTRHPPAPAAALGSYWAALALRPNSGHTLTNLGLCLLVVGRTDEALVCLERATQVRPDFVSYQYNFAVGLRQADQLDRARAVLVRITETKPDYANAYTELSQLALRAGDLTQASDLLRKAIKLTPQGFPMRVNLQSRLARFRDLQRTDEKLADVLAGRREPASPAEATDLGELCYMKGKHLDAYRLLKAAFAKYPGLTDDRVGAWHRYNAACYAALAAAGQGDGAALLTAAERAALRGDAIVWLRDELAALKRPLNPGSPRARLAAAEALHEWLADAALLAVRDPVALERLPAAERAAWRQLWGEVETILEGLN